MDLIIPLILNTPQVILFILAFAVVFFIGYFVGKETASYRVTPEKIIPSTEDSI